MVDITERDRKAAKKLISKYNLHPSDEDKIAAMIAARIADGDIGQFIDDFLKLKKPRNTLSWLSDETDEERKRRESLKAERRNKRSVEYQPEPEPLMTREQIAKLVVGQKVKMMCGVYGGRGKVVKITGDEVVVLVPAASDDEVRRLFSEYPPDLHEAIIDATKAKLFRFDKDGHETNESVNDRGLRVRAGCLPSIDQAKSSLATRSTCPSAPLVSNLPSAVQFTNW